MPITLISQKPTFEKRVEGEEKLSISEAFGNTIQGEGFSAGVPSTFIRLQGCTLKCIWCDTLDVWSVGNEYSFDEIFELFEINNLITKFKEGQHLILTGGSPLKQQKRLINFIAQFVIKYGFKPYIEVENEAVLLPDLQLCQLVDQWNNSPKLSNSQMKERARLKPDVIKYMSNLPNSWFKFVIKDENEWREIIKDYLPHIKSKSQIILMPEGQTQEELDETREIVAEMVAREGVRYSDRLQVVIFRLATSV